jgi:hypothetical protein
MGETQTGRQYSNLISPILFFLNKVSRLITGQNIVQIYHKFIAFQYLKGLYLRTYKRMVMKELRGAFRNPLFRNAPKNGLI